MGHRRQWKAALWCWKTGSSMIFISQPGEHIHSGPGKDRMDEQSGSISSCTPVTMVTIVWSEPRITKMFSQNITLFHLMNTVTDSYSYRLMKWDDWIKVTWILFHIITKFAEYVYDIYDSCCGDACAACIAVKDGMDCFTFGWISLSTGLIIY